MIVASLWLISLTIPYGKLHVLIFLPVISFMVESPIIRVSGSSAFCEMGPCWLEVTWQTHAQPASVATDFCSISVRTVRPDTYRGSGVHGWPTHAQLASMATGSCSISVSPVRPDTFRGSGVHSGPTHAQLASLATGSWSVSVRTVCPNTSRGSGVAGGRVLQ